MPSWWTSATKEDAPSKDAAAVPASSSLAPLDSSTPIGDNPTQRAQRDDDAQITALVFGFSESEHSPTGTHTTSSLSSKTEPSIASLPDTMSCRQAFDDAFYCQSLGGQFNNIYRYGAMRDCSEVWGQFWFCMRNRGAPENIKRARIREFYADKEAKYATAPSSCDVWVERTPEERVPRAFDWDPEKAGLIGKRSFEGKTIESADR